MKEKIIELRKLGKSYNEIAKELNCSKSLISYHLNDTSREKYNSRLYSNRFKKREELKDILGKKCNICGYNKCLAALHFHHKDPKEKRFEITDALWGRVKATWMMILEEVSKCELVCANCHAELHFGAK